MGEERERFERDRIWERSGRIWTRIWERPVGSRRERKVYYKVLAHVIMELASPKTFRVSRQAGDSEGAVVSVQILRQERSHPLARQLGRKNSFTRWEGIFRPSTDLARPIHIGEGNLLYSVYQFRCYSHTKTHHSNTQDNDLLNIWALHGPVKLTQNSSL